MNNHIFAAQTNQGTMRVFELAGAAGFKLAEMETLFNQLFPQYSHFVGRLRAIAAGDETECLFKRPHQWLVEIDDEPVGLINFTYSQRHNVGLGHNLAILPRLRRFNFGSFSRLSEILVYLAQQQLASDAGHAGAPEPAGLLVEVESPAATSDPVEQRRRQHLFARYQEYGAVEIPVCYFEPPGLIRADRPQEDVGWERLDFHPMELAIFPQRPAAELLTDGGIRNLVTAFLCDHYGLPTDHWAVTEALASIALPVVNPMLKQADRGYAGVTL
ncbi:MAG: hypothetical protein KDE04_03955 [Anaerolineales bacterium]|nr:hypothetical protein [Anaerolineales bacterium]